MNTEDSRDLKDLEKILVAFNAERDWERFHSPKNLAMALSIESAELLEHFLWSDENDNAYDVEKVAEEAADVLICLLNLCNRCKIDVGRAFYDKVAKNAAKYPVEKFRSSCKKYNE